MHRHPSAGPTRQQAQDRHLEMAAILCSADEAVRRLAYDRDPQPMARLVSGGGPLVAWSFAIIASHAYEHGGDAALLEALESLAADVEATS